MEVTAMNGNVRILNEKLDMLFGGFHYERLFEVHVLKDHGGSVLELGCVCVCVFTPGWFVLYSGDKEIIIGSLSVVCIRYLLQLCHADFRKPASMSELDITVNRLDLIHNTKR